MNKKGALLILTFALIFNGLKAQTLKYGDNLINVGIGIPSIPYNNYTSKQPSFNLSYMRGMSDKIGIGYISVGAQANFYGSELDNKNNLGEIKYNYTTLATRGAYHFDFKDITGDARWSNVDVYAGITAGVTFESAKYNGEKDNDSHLTTDVFAGINYTFYNNLAAFVECGVGVNYFNTGLAIKF